MGPDWQVEPVRPGPARSLPKTAHDKIGEKPLNRRCRTELPSAPNGVIHCRHSWLSEKSFFVLSALSKSNPLLAVFFIARRPSSIGFVLLAVVLSPSPSSRRPVEGKMDGAFVHQTMDKWPSSNLGYSAVSLPPRYRRRPHCTHGRRNASARLAFPSILSFRVCSELPPPLYRCASATVLPLRRLVELASSPCFCSSLLLSTRSGLVRGMSRLQGSSSSLKRKRELALVSDTLTDGERVLYNLILSKRDMGIWSGDMKRETNLPDNVVKKSLKLLQSKGLIKEVVNIQNKARKHYMAAQFEPSKEITGGDWYSEGNLDKELINAVKSVCLNYISRQKVVTCDGVLEWSRKSGVFTAEVSNQQIEEILRTLVLDDEIIEVKSTGYGDFENVPVGRVCYKCKSKGGVRGEPKDGAMSSIPCGVCPRINFCSPDGIVSPRTCVYYQKWLDF
ncbi:hypothetical protein Ahy_A07g036464 isoform B [Arachis hypogaea]|uniref:DNA-directed RNA polymerase III subunit RPC6 n=1 Tax=Arachis hypogaea TaxID=3818 RepID=A0A445CGA4_ARAHY|nr:hypothetical protein Ahy_A07g036464 isoform B [Arachis hypogaea]